MELESMRVFCRNTQHAEIVEKKNAAALSLTRASAIDGSFLFFRLTVLRFVRPDILHSHLWNTDIDSDYGWQDSSPPSPHWENKALLGFVSTDKV